MKLLHVLLPLGTLLLGLVIGAWGSSAHDDLDRCLRLQSACRAAQLDVTEQLRACQAARQDLTYYLGILRDELREHHEYVVPRLPVRKHYEWLLWRRK